MENSQPLGVFDSGVGGLTVVKSLWEHFPNEQIIYFGDTAHLPYGSRDPQEIIAFGKDIVSFCSNTQLKQLLQHAIQAHLFLLAFCRRNSLSRS